MQSSFLFLTVLLLCLSNCTTNHLLHAAETRSPLFDLPRELQQKQMSEWLWSSELAHLKTANANKRSREEQEAILSDKTFRLNSEVYFPEDIEEDPDKRQSFFAWIKRHGHAIKELDLSESNITGTEFAELAPSLINLEKLEIREEYSEIKNIELLFADLSKITTLRTLKINVRNEMTNTVYEHISKLVELRELKIIAQETDISKFPEESLIKHLIKLRHLQKLEIAHIRITENGLGLICELSQLQALTFFPADISTAGLRRNIGKLNQLQILTLLNFGPYDRDESARRSTLESLDQVAQELGMYLEEKDYRFGLGDRTLIRKIGP